jgi:hypothetical protein
VYAKNQQLHRHPEPLATSLTSALGALAVTELGGIGGAETSLGWSPWEPPVTPDVETTGSGESPTLLEPLNLDRRLPSNVVVEPDVPPKLPADDLRLELGLGGLDEGRLAFRASNKLVTLTR